jgi:hypothetical protein
MRVERSEERYATTRTAARFEDVVRGPDLIFDPMERITPYGSTF